MAWLVGACIATLAGVIAGLNAGGNGTGDYGNPTCADWSCDDPSRAFGALVRGDITGFFREQPAMGLTSLLVRAPAVVIAHAADSGMLGEYRAGAAVCLGLSCLIVTLLARLAVGHGVRLAPALIGLALWLTAVLYGRTLYFGHPEEPLAAVLALSAVAASAWKRPMLAGALLGLAMGTKEWALLVAPAVLFAGSIADWRRMTVGCGVAVAITVGVMAVGNYNSFHAAHERRGQGELNTATAANIWFRTGEKRVTGREGDRVSYEVYPTKFVGRVARPLVFALALVMSLLFWRRRGWDTAAAFALAAFVVIARVVFDTQTFSYHIIPMLILVTGWEVLGKRRFPFVALAAMGAFQLMARKLGPSPDISANTFNTIFLAWTLPLLVLLGVAALRRPPSR